MEKTFYTKLQAVQTGIKATKDQTNSFGGYKYRSAENILKAAKPLLAAQGLTLTLSDEVTEIGSRIYVKAVATLTDGTEAVSTQAYAREADDKKGMDVAQVTGATSSYARKYALCGLFLLDDNKDADTEQYTLVSEISKVRACKTTAELEAVWNASRAKSSQAFVNAVKDQKNKLSDREKLAKKEIEILNDPNRIGINGYRENEL